MAGHEKLRAAGPLVIVASVLAFGSPSRIAAQMAMASPHPESAAECAISEARHAAMLRAPYEKFDQSQAGDESWRGVLQIGCYAKAASLIAEYVKVNAPSLSEADTRTLNFHAGQGLAMGGQLADAAPFFEAAASGGTDEWVGYSRATLAFARRDRAAFDEQRKRYDVIAPKSPRRAILAGLASCFDKSYLDAVACAKM